MTTSRTRLMAITGATLALVMVGTAVTAAHGRGGDRGYGYGSGPGRYVEPFRQGGLGPLGLRGLRMGLSDSIVRTETTVDLGDDGIVTHRADNGSVTSATDTALEYTLATGETASVTIGEDTAAWALSQASSTTSLRPSRRVRLAAEAIAPADIAVGSAIMVTATSQEDGSFLATRIVVKPAAEASDEGTESADTTTEDAAADATEDASAVEAALAEAATDA
jgi:hypothetical protein